MVFAVRCVMYLVGALMIGTEILVIGMSLYEEEYAPVITRMYRVLTRHRMGYTIVFLIGVALILVSAFA